ncbi:MAG: hypothetical protein K6T55_08155 [Syntrophobacterales bacterium]|nr:hypothetical protein [Syntrophobacterales bacterium]
MDYSPLGQLVALAGLLLLLVVNLTRGHLRRQRRPSRGLLLLHQWGSLAAFALIFIGLGLMWLRKAP